MFKVKVITIGKVKDSWLKQALKEYEKRLVHQIKFEWVLLDYEKDLEEIAKKESNLIALDTRGKSLTSIDLSQRLFSKWGSRVSIAIGGAVGLSPEIIANAKEVISLSKLTFTHQMVRLILVEQLYRAIEIEKGSSYHK